MDNAVQCEVELAAKGNLQAASSCTGRSLSADGAEEQQKGGSLKEGVMRRRGNAD